MKTKNKNVTTEVVSVVEKKESINKWYLLFIYWLLLASIVESIINKYF
jgi:hypothetical protein